MAVWKINAIFGTHSPPIKTEVFFLCFLEKAKNKIKQVLRESSPRLWRPMIPVVE